VGAVHSINHDASTNAPDGCNRLKAEVAGLVQELGQAFARPGNLV
jgi:hypothetical protein